MSSGTVEPSRLSIPNTCLTPSTCSISPIIFLTSLLSMELSISTIWVEEMLKSSLSLVFAMTKSISLGRQSAIS